MMEESYKKTSELESMISTQNIQLEKEKMSITLKTEEVKTLQEKLLIAEDHLEKHQSQSSK